MTIFDYNYLYSTYFVGNKVKGRISKLVFQENKARQIFRKTNISYPQIRTRRCAYQWVRNVRFLENLFLRFAPLPYYRRFMLMTQPFSGLKPNLRKLEIAGIRVLKGVQVGVCGMRCIDLNNDTLKILGTHFSYNKKLKEEKKIL